MPAQPFRVVHDFEVALAEYCGAPYAISCTSCTSALLLAIAYHLRDRPLDGPRPRISIPKFTYVSVPMSIIHAGGWPTFRDEDWTGGYQLSPLPVWDYARRTTSNMFVPGQMQCLSLHWSKPLGVQQGGVVLTDDDNAYEWLKRSRFDGRTEGIPPKEDEFILGWHFYVSPSVAAEGLMRLSILPKHNDDLPNDDYPDLSALPLFR